MRRAMERFHNRLTEIRNGTAKPLPWVKQHLRDLELAFQIESDPDDEPTAGPVYGHCKVCGFPLDWSREAGLHCIALNDPERPYFAEAVRKHLELKP